MINRRGLMAWVGGAMTFVLTLPAAIRTATGHVQAIADPGVREITFQLGSGKLLGGQFTYEGATSFFRPDDLRSLATMMLNAADGGDEHDHSEHRSYVITLARDRCLPGANGTWEIDEFGGIRITEYSLLGGHQAQLQPPEPPKLDHWWDGEHQVWRKLEPFDPAQQVKSWPSA